MKFAFDIGRHTLPVPVVFTRQREIGLQVLLDDLVEDGSLGMALRRFGATGNPAASFPARWLAGDNALMGGVCRARSGRG